MSRVGRTVMTLVVAAIALVIVAWFDNTLMGDAQQQVQARADVAGLGLMSALGSLLVAGFVLVLGVLAWRSASVVVGLVYVVVGAFFAAQLWLWWNVASAGSDVLPEALAVPLRNLFHTSTGGSASLNDVATIGGAMLIAGVVALARWWRVRNASVVALDPQS